MKYDPHRMTSKEAAVYLRREEKTLRGWRSKGRGPEYTKEGRSVWYSLAQLDWWKEQAGTVIKPRKVL